VTDADPKTTAATPEKLPEDYHEKAVYLARYSEHNARLQTWIGGYGAGLASLLVYQFRTAVGDTRELWRNKGPKADAALNAVLAEMHYELSCSLRLIAAAIAIQVVLLALNKSTQFAQAHMSDQQIDWSPWDKFSIWFSDKYWFDALCDIASICLLATATVFGIEALGLTP
jgi:hypothetical protein